MNILIPMAGAGSRFSQAGYKVSKPAILTTDRLTGKKYPMVVLATRDLPDVAADGANVIYVDRDFHKTLGVEAIIRESYPKARFITTSELTEGQASTCLLARDFIDNGEELLIAGCDNGMVFDHDKFNRLRCEADVLVFTYRHHEAVLKNPNAYGYCRVDESNNITAVAVKKTISANPVNDHAIVATFWFKHGYDFVESANMMIADNDRINGEFYVDEVIAHSLELGLCCKVLEIDRYIGWGTPEDYENYEQTLSYWHSFISSDSFMPKD